MKGVTLKSKSSSIDRRQAYFAVLGGAIIAGFTGLFIKHIHMDAGSLAFVRTIVPAAVLGIWLRWKQVPFFRGNYQKMLLASCFNAVRMYLFIMAYIYTSISTAVIILFTWPIFVNIMGFIWLRENIGIRQIGLLVLAFLGIFLVYLDYGFSISSADVIGISSALGSALFFSISYVMFKSEIQEYSRNEIIFYQNIVGSICFLPFFIVAPWPGYADWILSLSYGSIMGIALFHFFFFGLKHLPASRASIIHYFEIVSAVATGVIFMGDALTINMLLGGICIVISTLLLKRLSSSEMVEK